MARLSLFLVLASSILVPRPCAAGLAMQNGESPTSMSSAPTAGLDVEAAVALALRSNPGLRAFRKERALAEGELVSAGALPNPTLKLEILHAQDASQLGWGGTLSMVPPQPVVLSARRGQAQARISEVKSAVAEREWNLASQVRITHATLIELREQRRIHEAAVAVRQRLLSVLRTRLQRGASTRIELNLAELAGLQARRSLDEIELRNVQAQAELQSLLGIASSEPLILHGERFTPTLDAGPVDAAALFSHALSRRPLLKAAHARIAQREQTLRLEKARRWPWFELSGRYRQDGSARSPHDVQLGVQLSLPIFNTNAGPIQVAAAELERERAVLEAQVVSIEQNIRAACTELAVRREILLRFHREVLPILNEHEQLMEAAVRGSQLDLVALLTSEESVLRSRREESEARLAYQRSWLLLEQSMGAPLQEVAQ